MVQQLTVRKGFKRFNDQQVVARTHEVIAGLTGNSAFLNLPVELSAVQAALDQFVAAIAATADGGPTSTAEKNNKREALLGLVTELAHYVERNSKGNLAVLLSSGFQAVIPGGTRSELPKPSVVSVEFGPTTKLFVRVRTVPRAKCYEARASALAANGAASPWQSAGLSTDSRFVEVNGLTPGTNYAVQVRAVGGATGFSEWSDPVVHMSA